MFVIVRFSVAIRVSEGRTDKGREYGVPGEPPCWYHLAPKHWSIYFASLWFLSFSGGKENDVVAKLQSHAPVSGHAFILWVARQISRQRPAWGAALAFFVFGAALAAWAALALAFVFDKHWYNQRKFRNLTSDYTESCCWRSVQEMWSRRCDTAEMWYSRDVTHEDLAGRKRAKCCVFP